MARYRRRLAALAGACVIVLAGCTAGTPSCHPTPTAELTPSTPQARTNLPTAETTVVDGAGAAELALATSRALYAHAQAVVLTADGDGSVSPRATHGGGQSRRPAAADADLDGRGRPADRAGPTGRPHLGDRRQRGDRLGPAGTPDRP